MAQSIANRRVRALPAIGFGLLALAVALVGLLATLLTLVAERRRDLAIRSALGASPRRLVLAIVAQGLTLTALGLTTGLAVAGAAAQGVSSFLYQVDPHDTTTFAGTALVIGASATLVTCVAALRARSVDPVSLVVNE